jgi:pyruvate, orthophosphate dikinase
MSFIMKYFVLIITLFCGNLVEAYQTYSTVSHKLESLVEKVNNRDISIPDALLSIEGQDIDMIIKSSVIYSDEMDLIAEAQGTSTGAAQGVLCFDLKELARLKKQYGSVIWVTDHISNDDLCHLKDIAGIFALKEDPSSHAIIVTRVSNIPCLTSPQNVVRNDKSLLTPSGEYYEGDLATLDAFNGKLFSGSIPLHQQVDKVLLNKIMVWAEQFSKLSVHGNADTVEECKLALEFGAKGVDPRTEHMFFHPERLHLFRKVILSRGENKAALQELESYQRMDFIDLYQTMKTYPVKIRLLDPPLHEFLPTDETLLNALAQDLNIPLDSLKNKVDELSEVNPMMGNRGVRLLITFPEVLKMQARAIFEAALDPSLTHYSIEPYIVIPMIISINEIILVKAIIDGVREEIRKKSGKDLVYHLGVMMETPRACLLAGEIAPHVDFISFGTNDLTGQTLALSRGDVYNKFLKYYIDMGLLEADPFSQLDPAVIQLIKITIEQMRQASHPITIGICGEQASEKSGVFLCNKLGFNTVSCAPTRVSAVKLFAAQAALSE